MRLSLARILRQVKWWLVTMVTRYDIISSRCSSHFWVKIHVFSTSLNNKSKACRWKDASAYLCVFYMFSTQEFPVIAVFTWFLILGKIQDRGQDCDHCWWRHRSPAAPSPIKHTSSCWENWKIKTFHWRQNRFEIPQHTKTSWEGLHQPPPPPLVPRWGVCRVCMYIRGLIIN